jgi:hypothetical protein
VLGGWDAVLVFVAAAISARVGFREPVGGADKGRLGVDVVGALLLARGDRGFVDGGGA